MFAGLLVFGVGAASADDFHGIAFVKGCESPTKIGDPYNCAYSVVNTVDTAHDSIQIKGLTDVVHSAGGDVSSGNILGGLELVFTGAVTCTGGSGSGTVADPYVGATSCTLPFSSSIQTNSHSFYTVQAGDYALPNHTLHDSASLNWNDLCTGTSNNCTTAAQTNSAGSSSVILQLDSQTTTDIHNGTHQVVTAVEAGSTVHDFVTVTGQPNSPIPSGNVTIDWFTNATCAGEPAASSGSIGPLDPSGHLDATGFPQGPLAAGLYAFRAHYLGDATYSPSDGPCEPLRVVDANIQISPNGVNRVGQTHTFTAHVNVSSGSGFVNAPDGTQISFTIDSGPGAFMSPNPCTTSGGTGSCTVDLSSAVTGVSTVSAHVTLTVGGVSLTRDTDGAGANSGPATKRWVNAAISIAPSATNEVGHPHTFTVTLTKDVGDGEGFVAAVGEHVDFTLTDAHGATHSAATGTCTGAGANTDANGQCTITFTSSTAGTVTGHASATLSVAGSAPFTVATDGAQPNSGDAVKTFVDANVQISPLTAVNPVGTTHTLTGHVNVNDGSGAGFVNAPDGTVISFALTNASGATATFVGPAGCTTSGGTGSCLVTISSPTPGVTTIKASTDVAVGGVSLHRETGDELPGDSPDAMKNWASARISIAPSATNEVGHSHTFTVTLEQDTGTGTFVPAAGQHVDVTLTDANGAVHSAPTGTCTTAGPNTNANGQCTVTFTSNTAGTVTGHATATIAVDGHALTVSTNGVGGNSGDAVKTFVDANIQISPPTANNPVATNHTLTAHVNVNGGSGFANAPVGTAISFALTNSGGASAVFVGPTSCTTVGATGSCSVTISSSTVGTTAVKASTTVSVGGVLLTRTTGDAKAGDSSDGVKTWANATVRTDILNASGTVVTTVVSGTVVHDRVSVQRVAGTPASVPNPTGTVVFHRYTTADCSGTSTDQTVALTAGDPSTAVTADFAPTANMSYKADYLGDANYPAGTGACEPLSVTPQPAPAIAIVKNPKGQTLPVGGTARFQITVTNTGNTVLTNVTVTDPLSPNCNRTSAQIPALASMAPGASVTYSCSRPNVKQNYTNKATATGTPPSGPNVTASDTAPVKVTPLPPTKKHPKVVSHKRPKATG